VSLGYLPQTLIMVFARACAYTSSLFVGMYITLRWQWRMFFPYNLKVWFYF
jgi:hypothetical protein